MTISSHAKRWITSLVLLPLLAAILLLGGWWLFVAVALVSCVGQMEFYSMFWPGVKPFRKAFGLAMGVLLLLCAALHAPLWGGALALALFWLLQLRYLFRYASAPHMADYGADMLLFAGLVYVPGMLQLFLYLEPLEVLLVLLTTFASDTGAYYSGSLFGNKKVWPDISPKKTWAGSWGGLAACVLVALAFGLFWQGAPWEHAPLGLWIVIGMLLNLAAQFGDFFESALKRSLDVKDSGTFLPGHGGVLDRIDGLLLSLPVYMLCRSLYLLYGA